MLNAQSDIHSNIKDSQNKNRLKTCFITIQKFVHWIFVFWIIHPLTRATLDTYYAYFTTFTKTIRCIEKSIHHLSLPEKKEAKNFAHKNHNHMFEILFNCLSALRQFFFDVPLPDVDSLSVTTIRVRFAVSNWCWSRRRFMVKKITQPKPMRFPVSTRNWCVKCNRKLFPLKSY